MPTSIRLYVAAHAALLSAIAHVKMTAMTAPRTDRTRSLFKYTFNGTSKRRKMPSVSPSARYTFSRNRIPLHLKLAQCYWCWLFLTVDWQHVLATGRHTDI